MRNGQEEEEEEQERSGRERWNSLPRIWRSLGREVRERERERWRVASNAIIRQKYL